MLIDAYKELFHWMIGYDLSFCIKILALLWIKFWLKLSFHRSHLVICVFHYLTALQGMEVCCGQPSKYMGISVYFTYLDQQSRSLSRKQMVDGLVLLKFGLSCHLKTSIASQAQECPVIKINWWIGVVLPNLQLHWLKPGQHVRTNCPDLVEFWLISSPP